MTEFYLWATALTILIALVATFQRTRDALAPMVTFAPMLLYVYVYHPFVIRSSPEFSQFFPHEDQIEHVFLIDFLSIAAFCLGACFYRRSQRGAPSSRILEMDLSPQMRSRFVSLSLVLATMASTAFWYLISISGGVMQFWRFKKPFFSSASGYIGEMPMLTYPALMLLAAAWHGQRLNLSRWLCVLFVASPQIAWGILGKRRGTIFLIAAALAAVWFLVRNKKPDWKLLLGGVSVLGLILLTVSVYRSQWGQVNINPEVRNTLGNVLAGEHLDQGDEFVSAAAVILASDRFNLHYWGVRFFATLFVRPIPSFLWESKWEDLGLRWMKTSPGMCGLTTLQWTEAIGFSPVGGSAGGFVGDLYLEWSWGGIFACYFLGLGFSWLWKQWIVKRGVWTMIYIEAMILSIHLPSQSLGSWAYRFMLIAIPTAICFRLLSGRNKRFNTMPQSQPQSQPEPRPALIPRRSF